MRRILVGSGKGGVGKSTTAAAIALFLAGKGYLAGLLDADLAGPSMPVLLGHRGPVAVDDGMMLPVLTGQVRSMSTGYLAPAERAIVWSGAMLEGALWQMIHETRWGELDVMIVDLPPGTNELHVKIVEELGDDAESVLVTNDDPLSLADTLRALDFFMELALPPVAAVFTAVGQCGGMSEKRRAGKLEQPSLSIGAHEVPVVRIPASPVLSRTPIDVWRIGAEDFSGAADSQAGELYQSLTKLVELCKVMMPG